MTASWVAAGRFVGGVALASLAGGCDDARARLDAAPELLSPALLDGGTSDAGSRFEAGSTKPPLLPNWCDSAPVGGAETSVVFAQVSAEYLARQAEVCARLTRDMTREQHAAWENYLYDYTRVMVGCVMIDAPPPGGILAFGPANTRVVGFAHAGLSRTDAGVLIEAYASAFARALGLSDAERGLVEAHLWRSADAEIDPTLADRLSVCEDRADAGG